MGKIKVTESELRKIIAENVIVVLKEDMQSRRNEKYMNAQTALANAQKSWEQLTPDEKQPYMINAGGNDAMGKQAYEYGQQARIAKAQNVLNRKTRRNGLQFQADAQNKDAEIQRLNAQVTSLTNDKNNAIKTASGYENSLRQISKALGLIKENVNENTPGTTPAFDSSLAGAPQAGQLNNQLPDLNMILTKIKQLNGTITKQTEEIGNLKAQLVQKQQTPAQPAINPATQNYAQNKMAATNNPTTPRV